jgi:hypothetical protein
MSLTVLINKLMIHMYSMSLPNTRIQTYFFLHQKNPEFIVFNFTLAIFRAISLSELLFLYCFQLRPFDHFIWSSTVSSTSHGSYKHKTVCEKDNINDVILKPKYKRILPLTLSDSDSEWSLWLYTSEVHYFTCFEIICC